MGRPTYTAEQLATAREHRNELRRAQYQLDGGKRKAENQEWKDAHRDQVRAASREYQRIRYAVDPERAKRLNRESYQRNRVKRISETKAWFAAHPGYDAKKQAEYRKKDPIKFMLRNAKNRAKEAGREFSITRADINVPDVCPVLGIPLAKADAPFKPNSPSLDRYDSAKGYIPGNVFVISNRANLLKRDGTLAEFRKIVTYLERG